MLLAVDVGNTNTVFALFAGQDLRQSWRCKTETARSGDEYAVFLNQLFALNGTQWTDVSDIIISSVVPETNFHLENFARTYLKRPPLFVDHKNVGITIGLPNPAEVGADRIVNAVAVLRHYRAPAVVIDFGTATTFDVIDAGGTYCGGVIAPGVRLSIEALTRRAAKLPQVAIKAPAKIVGTDTAGAMQSGMYWGYIGLIEGILTRIADEIGVKPFTIATGGLAGLYAQNTPMIDAVDDALILKGLLEIYGRNNPS